MSIRSCARCGAPLEAADDVCPLGHSVGPAPISEIAELRAKVDEAFAAAEAELQVLTRIGTVGALPETVDPAPFSLPTPPAQAPPAPLHLPEPAAAGSQPVWTPPVPAPRSPSVAPIAPPPAPEAVLSTPITPEPLPLGSAAQAIAASPIPPPARPPIPPAETQPRAASPPPPPPPPAPLLYKPLPAPEEDRLDDPIAAFAPAARLDWGPQRPTASRTAELRRRFNK